MSDSNWGQLTDEQVEKIAEKAAEKAVAKLTDRVYQEVGKGVVQKLLWIVGAVCVGLYLWLHSKGVVR